MIGEDNTETHNGKKTAGVCFGEHIVVIHISVDSAQLERAEKGD